ncbi:MAG TPA: hypothetical protein VFZ81_05265 [Burkholderiales bacterium]
MKLKTLIALAVAGAFAVPLAAQASADGDRMILAAGGASGASSTGTGMTGATAGAAAADFSSLDRNSDGQISRAEWDAHFRSGSAGASTSGGASTSAAPSGPGTASQAGPGSDTATTPGTSGKGKAQ